MLKKGRKVRPGAKIGDVYVICLRFRTVHPRRLLHVALTLAICLLLLPSVIDGAAIRARHFLCDLAYKLLEGGNCSRAEVWSRNSDIRVEVCDRILQTGLMLLHPLGRTDKSLFFSVPRSDHNLSLRLPSLLQQLAQAVYRFQHGRRSTVWIDRSVDPGIAMISRHHPVLFLGGIGSVDRSDDVPDRSKLRLLLQVHMHCHLLSTRCTSQVVGKWQPTLPVARRLFPAQGR